MKKFYVNAKVMYLHVTHNVLSAQVLLRKLGIIGRLDKVRQASDEEQDMLDIPGPEFDEVVIAVEDNGCESCQDDLEGFFIDMLGDEDYDYYTLPNGKSAPYGMTGEELASTPERTVLYSVNLNIPGNILEAPKNRRNSNHMFVEVERDLIFATREKAVEAYNALFGDLYGEI